jgi:hypothetical protein
MNKILRKNITLNKLKNKLTIDSYSYNTFQNEIKKVYTLPTIKKYPYFPIIFIHLMDDSVRMWLFLNDEEIYSKIQDECSIHILINSFFLTIIINLLLVYDNNIQDETKILTNEYIYYISGTLTMSLLVCAVANMMIIVTNINKSNPQLIRFEIAKNIENFSHIFKLSAFAFYSFILFISLGLYTTKKYILNYICSMLFISICIFYSSPLSIAFKTNYNSSPRLMLNIMPWSDDLRKKSADQMYTLMLNLKNTNNEFSIMVDDIINSSENLLITNNV